MINIYNMRNFQLNSEIVILYQPIRVIRRMYFFALDSEQTSGYLLARRRANELILDSSLSKKLYNVR